jgi:predicted KAP-like P-loop ATPase
MNKNFSSDKAVFKKKDDKFQRYEFAKRIATTIIERDSEDCIVIGLYGAWGEGKTSIINFIDQELSENENMISLKFNPWRYNDENSLLIQFFNLLAKTLDNNLKTKNEKVGEFLKKYGKLVSIDIPLIGNLGDALQNTGEALDNIDVESLKERIEQILKETNSKIVVFIDDIDRLDKLEIHAIFRLVKLTADFTNTTYILSFDEEMVSAAIGERFGSGSQKSGQNFLEKIIQVPLKIPVAQPTALKEFCFELVDRAIQSNGIVLSQDEERRFVYHFTTNILNKLETPRLAVRYGNTLTFAMPLLYGEVNIVDLMLLEAIKIFYPEYYEFIKLNPDLFLESTPQIFGNVKISEGSELKKEDLDNIGQNLTKVQKTNIERLISELFPQRKHNYTYSENKDITDQWFKNKRIASSKYFDKYFSYSVIKGDISDIVFNNLILDVANQNEDELVDSLKTIIAESNAENLLYKLRSIEEDIDWETAKKIAKAISLIPELLPNTGHNSFMSFSKPTGQASIFIYQLIKNHNNKNEQISFAKELLKNTSFEFAFQLNQWLQEEIERDNKLFNESQNKDLIKILIENAITASKTSSIFEKFQEESNYIISSWQEIDKKALNKYVKTILKFNPLAVIDLLKTYTPTATSTAVVGPYKTDFSKEQYNYFITVFDKKFIYNIIKKVYTLKILKEDEVKWTRFRENKQSDLNIARQYNHWYEEVNPTS